MMVLHFLYYQTTHTLPIIMPEQTDQHIWHTLIGQDTLETLASSSQGLSQEEAKARLEHHGPNSLPEQKTERWHTLALRQFASPLVYVLLAVVVITFALGEVIDGSIIAAVLIFNAVIGAYQEGRAQSAILALRSYEHDSTLVRRNGKELLVDAKNIVPGDILVILEGNRIPADARILKTEDISIDEAILTGESKTKVKTINAIEEANTVPGDRTNMLFKGTYASRGKAEAVVVATGLQTEIGKLSQQVALYEAEIPLQRKIKVLTNRIVLGVLGLLAILVVVAIAQGYPTREIFLTTASLLVAIMPEGLPIVVTLVLAQGVQRMAKNNVLVKRLQAVEALGNADIIAVDKTGTLTRNELSVTRIILPTSSYAVEGVGYESTGEIKPIHGENSEEMLTFAKYSTLSANAEIFWQEDTFTLAGDPTEAAMLVLGQRAGFNKHELLKTHKLLDEIAFSYKRKYYANLHTYEDHNIVIVTGAPEVVLDFTNTEEKAKQKLLHTVSKESSQGHRVIALAYKTTDNIVLSEEEVSDLTFGGLFIMEDQIRSEVPDAMKKAQAAKIKVVMITGDYPSTAQSIATAAGIYKEGDRVLSGTEIEQMNDQDLAMALPATTVFARVTPEHKLRVIRGFRALNKTIAMTGDGVNDVPSLVAADLGVAMGKIGTEAAKAASDIVLLDDNFGNIPKAVEEGKRIFQSIKKVVTYLMSTNTGEVMIVAYAIIIGASIPLNPAQIVWLNLLTDSFLVFPLTTEKQKTSRRSDKYSKSLITSFDALRILVVSLAMVGSFVILRELYGDVSRTLLSTLTLTTVVMSQIWIALSLRNRKTFSEIFSNTWFWLAVVSVLLIQAAAVYLPALQQILRTTSLSQTDWMIAVGASLLVPLADVLFVTFHKIFKNH